MSDAFEVATTAGETVESIIILDNAFRPQTDVASGISSTFSDRKTEFEGEIDDATTTIKADVNQFATDFEPHIQAIQTNVIETANTKLATFAAEVSSNYAFEQDTLNIITSAVTDEVTSFSDCTGTVKTDLEGAWDAMDIDTAIDQLTTDLKTTIGAAFDAASTAATDGTTELTETDMKKLANPTLNVANKELNSGLKTIQKEAFNVINDIAKELKTTIKKDSKTCQNNVKKAIKKGEKSV